MDLKKLKEKNELVPEVFTVTRTVEVKIWKLDLSDDIDNDLLKEHILEYKENNPESFTSNIQAWHTPYRTHFLTGIFDQFLQVVNQKINSIIPTDPFYHYEVDEIWAAILSGEPPTVVIEKSGYWRLCL